MNLAQEFLTQSRQDAKKEESELFASSRLCVSLPSPSPWFRFPRHARWAWRLSMNRRKHRQVLDCGDGVCGVAALDREPARTRRAGAFGDAGAKAVNRFARHRTPRRWRDATHSTRFMVPMRGETVDTFHEPTHRSAGGSPARLAASSEGAGEPPALQSRRFTVSMHAPKRKEAHHEPTRSEFRFLVS